MSQQSRLSMIALVALLALGAFAASASAAPLSMTFTESRANVGVQLSDAALFEAPDTAPLEAQIDPGSGWITGGSLQVPNFSTFVTDPVDADVTVEFEIGLITGTFVPTIGALALSGEAGGTLTANGKECIVSTTPAILQLSTAGVSGVSPRPGAPFTAGLGGAGAIAGQWTDMHATPVDPGPGGDKAVCETVDERIGGPGGIWLEQEGNATSSSQPQPTTTDSGEGTGNPPPPPARACIVPKLTGKTPARARVALKAAGCKLGKVRRTKPPKGQGQRPVVVKASTPAAGTSPANGKVHLRLGPKPRA